MCLKQGKHRVPYDAVEEKIETVMRETAHPMREVVEQCKEFDEDQVLDTIRFLVDNGVLQVEKDGSVKKKDNKKSRQL